MAALPQQDLRCAFCHGPLRYPEAESCGDCHTLLHRECALSLKACPTLGCANEDLRARRVIRVTLELPWGRWIFAAFVFPLIALIVDYHLNVNPLIWGKRHFLATFNFDVGYDGPPRSGPGLGVALRMVVVYAGGLLSAAGMAFLAAGRARQSLPYLAFGVVYAGAHALAFAPLLPISVIGIFLFGVGLFGLVPFLALSAFVELFERARRSVLASTPDGPPWLEENLGSARVVAAFLASLALAGGLYFGLEDLGRPPVYAWENAASFQDLDEQALWDDEADDEVLDDEWIQVESHEAPARGAQVGEEPTEKEPGEEEPVEARGGADMSPAEERGVPREDRVRSR